MPDKSPEIKKNILIVEDEDLMPADLESRLKRLEHTVCGKAIGGEKAWGLKSGAAQRAGRTAFGRNLNG